MAQTSKIYELHVILARVRKKIIFSLLGILAVTNSSCTWAHQADPPTTSSRPDSFSPATIEPPPAAKVSETLKLTPSELLEFDSTMLELDPEQQLVKKITQQKLSTTVNMTIGPGFSTLNQRRQTEIAVAMRDGLSQVCSCSPYLRFNTEDGQPLVEIDQYLKWQ